MALRFMDGFDHYQSADFLTKWTSLTQNGVELAISATGGRYGGGCLSMANPRSGVTLSLDSQATWLLNFAMKVGAGTPSATTILGLLDTGTLHMDLRINAARQLYVTRNATTLGAAGSTALTADVWYWIGVKFTIDDSAGVAQVQINGVDEINLTAQDTRNAAASSANQIRLGQVSNIALAFSLDDFVLMDGQAGMNALLANRRIWTTDPVAAGNSAQWTGTPGANWANVHASVPSAVGPVNYASVAGYKDTFVFEDAPAASGNVEAIQHVVYAKHDGAARSIRTLERVSGTDYTGATQALASSYKYYRQIREVNPATSSKFTVAEFNGAEFGYELVS